ncbi:MAG: DNA gyrase subunit A [Verrucomicrobium sp.]|nr:DNA gyrase subunit A [Verrucomicrobium sp.]
MADEKPSGGSLFTQGEKLQSINVSEEMRNCFLDYSMSVIISRALPDVRDGLKPSQRRILYAMSELGLAPTRKHLKCAKIVGETMGNYHPHGDSAIYPTLVHLAQPWAIREPLIDGQGNFGSIEGDPPAAMRYTEARLTHLGMALMEDMEKETVDFAPNYDESTTEPVVLPAAFPNLLVNGSTGIAVGMATNIPPHNLIEIVDGVCAVIDKPEITIDALMKIVKGPDFPLGATILGIEGIRNYFTTGRGSVKTRAKVHTEEQKGGRTVLIVDEIPFNVNRATLVERIGELVRDKIITDITDVRDESDENTRVVIEIKRDAVPKVVLNNLYKLTALETSFAVNMLAIDHGKPKTLNLKELIHCYIEHRREVILRRTRFELRKAEERAELLEGYLIAQSNLDEFIRIIRESKNREEAKIQLQGYEFPRKQVEKWGVVIRDEQRLSNGLYLLSERQIDAILELRLYQLTGLERDKIEKEYNGLIDRIKDLVDILAKEIRVLTIIKHELRTLRDKHGTERRTEIVPDEGEMKIEDLIANEGVIITLTHKGLLKRTNINSYRAQRRGGRGVIGISGVTSSDEKEKGDDTDFIEHLFTASTHDYLLFFTNTGRVYIERVYEVPEMGRAAKGKSIANLLELKSEEKIAAMIRIISKRDGKGEDVTWESEDEHIFFSTEQGTVKKTRLSDFANIRKGGIIAIGIEQGDRLISVELTDGKKEMVLITREGMSIRFDETQVRAMGRQAGGVKGITLEKGDAVVAAAAVNPQATLLVAGENGVGKRTPFDEYRSQTRGGKGIITMKTTEKTGLVAGALTVTDADELMLITEKGLMVRTPVQDIREVGRNTQGVKLINLEPGDKLLAIAPVISEKGETGESTELPG